MSDVDREIACTVVRKMFASWHFEICSVRKAAVLLGRNEHSAEIDALRRYHCVNWADMPRGFPAQLAARVAEALGLSPGDFGQARVIESTAAEVAPAPVGLLRRIGVVR